MKARSIFFKEASEAIYKTAGPGENPYGQGDAFLGPAAEKFYRSRGFSHQDIEGLRRMPEAQRAEAVQAMLAPGSSDAAGPMQQGGRQAGQAAAPPASLGGSLTSPPAPAAPAPQQAAPAAAPASPPTQQEIEANRTLMAERRMQHAGDLGKSMDQTRAGNGFWDSAYRGMNSLLGGTSADINDDINPNVDARAGAGPRGNQFGQQQRSFGGASDAPEEFMKRTRDASAGAVAAGLTGGAAGLGGLAGGAMLAGGGALGAGGGDAVRQYQGLRQRYGADKDLTELPNWGFDTARLGNAALHGGAMVPAVAGAMAAPGIAGRAAGAAGSAWGAAPGLVKGLAASVPILGAAGYGASEMAPAIAGNAANKSMEALKAFAHRLPGDARDLTKDTLQAGSESVKGGWDWLKGLGSDAASTPLGQKAQSLFSGGAPTTAAQAVAPSPAAAPAAPATPAAPAPALSQGAPQTVSYQPPKATHTGYSNNLGQAPEYHV